MASNSKEDQSNFLDPYNTDMTNTSLRTVEQPHQMTRINLIRIGIMRLSTLRQIEQESVEDTCVEEECQENAQN
ncbi:hypothetical protein FQR65_LT12504 [Abscondita terminalis]|nr:hypothetical protein FQR65_LT12504 [Abscondita terminalis]